MRAYTVLLAYPQHLAASDNQTYMTDVLAANVTQAIAAARNEVMFENSDDDPTTTWHVLMVCEGVINDIKHEAEADER